MSMNAAPEIAFSSEQGKANYAAARRQYPAQAIVDLKTMRDNMAHLVSVVGGPRFRHGGDGCGQGRRLRPRTAARRPGRARRRRHMARHRAVARSVAAAQARHRPRPLPYFDLGIQRHRSPVRRADRRRHRRIGRLPARHRRGGRRRTQARQARPRTRQGRFRLWSQRFHTGRIRRRARQTRAARQRGRVAYCGSVEPSRRGRFARCVRIRVLHRPPDRNIQGLHAPHGTGRHSAGDPSPGQHSGHFGPPRSIHSNSPAPATACTATSRSRDGHPARLASDPGHAPCRRSSARSRMWRPATASPTAAPT